MGDRLRVQGDGGRIGKLHRQTRMGNQVKDIEGALNERMRGKGVTERENGEFKMTISELTASSLFLPY